MSSGWGSANPGGRAASAMRGAALPPPGGEGREPSFSVALTLLLAGAAALGCNEKPEKRVAAPAGAQPEEQRDVGKNRGAAAADDAVPAALRQLARRAVDVYETARQGDWRKAQASYAALRDALRPLELADVPAQRVVVPMRAAVAALGPAIRNRRRQAAMLQANDVTRIAAELSDPAFARVPPGVLRLGYFSRELEMTAAPRRVEMARLRILAESASYEWERLRPLVIAAGGTAIARRLDAVMARLATAETQEEYLLLSSRISEHAEELEAHLMQSEGGSVKE